MVLQAYGMICMLLFLDAFETIRNYIMEEEEFEDL
jgi:hypothetical protein